MVSLRDNEDFLNVYNKDMVLSYVLSIRLSALSSLFLNYEPITEQEWEFVADRDLCVSQTHLVQIFLLSIAQFFTKKLFSLVWCRKQDL